MESCEGINKLLARDWTDKEIDKKLEQQNKYAHLALKVEWSQREKEEEAKKKAAKKAEKDRKKAKKAAERAGQSVESVEKDGADKDPKAGDAVEEVTEGVRQAALQTS